MATQYQTSNYAQATPSGTGHGLYKENTHLHAISPTISTWAAGDTVLVGYLPANAVIVGCVLKAASQLDSNGTPTLTLSVGIVGNTGLFKTGITTVGRIAGASADIGTGITAAGYLYRTTAKAAVIVTVATAAATPVAGTLEVDVEYYVEDAAGSNP